MSLRYDCFDEERDESDDFGLENRAKVEGRLSQLEGRDMRTTSKVVREQPKVEITEARAYNADADSTAAAAAAAPTADSDDEESETEEVEEKKSKKDKKKDKKEKKDKKKDKKRKRDDDKEDKESSKN